MQFIGTTQCWRIAGVLSTVAFSMQQARRSIHFMRSGSIARNCFDLDLLSGGGSCRNNTEATPLHVPLGTKSPSHDLISMYNTLTRGLLAVFLPTILAGVCWAQPFIDGIDVSNFQGNVNWNSVLSDGYEFAFMKATEGVGFTDARFTQNITGAVSAGVLAAPYHFARPDSGVSNPLDAVNEANYFLDAIEPYYNTGTYLPPVLDVERFDVGMSLSQTRTFISNWVNDFSDTVFDSLGVRPLIYTSQSHANTYYNSSVTSQHDLWVAWYRGSGTSNPPEQSDNPAWPEWKFWQYTDSGSVAGISGDVDLNVFNGTRPQLEALLVGEGVTEPGDVVNITNFEIDEGYFGFAPDFSGSNQGIFAGTTADRVTTMAQAGSASQELNIVGDAGGWFLRHLAGIGSPASPASNLELDATGYVGFWLKTDDPGVSVQIALDDPGTADRGISQDVVADGEWHLYEWNLEDNSQWEAWVAGNGTIDGPTLTLDSIQFSGAGNALLYLDSISHNPLGSLSPMVDVLLGDADNTLTVSGSDLLAVTNNFGNTGPADGLLLGDADDNGTVSGSDLLAVTNNFGATLSSSLASSPQGIASPVPEPASGCAALVLSAMLVCFSGSRK